MSTERRYDPKSVEPKWQALWERERAWGVSNDDPGGDPFYVLEMLPYPSGDPHMGHLKNYAAGDAVAHIQRRVGRRGVHPTGSDAVGLPAGHHHRTGRAAGARRARTSATRAASPRGSRPRSRSRPSAASSTAGASAST